MFLGTRKIIKISVILNQCDPKRGLRKKITSIYCRDVYNHAVRLMEVFEMQIELAVSIREIHPSSLSKLNETMKILTVIVIIFIPLISMAEIYEINFKYMLHWNDYLVVLTARTIIALIMSSLF